MVIMGVMLLDDQERSCVVQIEQTPHHAFVLEARRLAPLPSPQAEPPSLRLSGSDSMPVNSVLRLLAALVAGRSVDGDLEYTLLGISVAPTIDPITLAATIQLRSDARAANRVRLDFLPVTRRPVGFRWSDDWPIERWLRALRRTVTGRPPTHPLFVDQPSGRPGYDAA